MKTSTFIGKSAIICLLWFFGFFGAQAQFTVTKMVNPDSWNSNLYGVFNLNKDYGFAAGDNTLLKRQGNNWSTIDLGSVAVSVWADTPSNIIVIGESGLIYHSDGQTASVFATLSHSLICAKFFTANDYFVGGVGNLYHYKDGNWTTYPLVNSNWSVVGIEGDSAEDLCLFISGSTSKVAYYKNNTIIDGLPLNFFMQSFCKFQNKYYLCGTDSKEYVYDKGNNSVSHLSDCSAYSIWAIDTNNVLLGNGDGYVSKFDGLSLSNVYTTDQYHVIRNFSASADDPNTIYAVGDKGIILKIVKTDVGIEDFKFSPDINIYPNPAKDFVTLDLGTASQTTQILIFDQTGKMVLRTETNKPKTTISLSNLDSGFYFIRGESANNSFTKKLLIKR